MAAVWHMWDSDGQHCEFRMGLELFLEISDVLLEHCKHPPWQVCPACLSWWWVVSTQIETLCKY